MKYKCIFKFDYDDFMGRRSYTFYLYYKPKKLLASTRKIEICYSNCTSNDFDKDMNEFMKWVIDMPQEDLINLAIKSIKENEFIMNKDKSDKTDFENKLNEVNRKLSKFKFEVEI